MTDCLMIFAKAPQLGGVKTRLCMRDIDAVKLHSAFVKDVIHTSIGHWDRSLWTDVPEHAFFQQFDLEVSAQIGTGLGPRLCYGFQETLRHYRKVVVIGTDAPTLSAALLNAAFEALDDADAVIGPSLDGGYYLLGLTALNTEIFDSNLDWSGPRLFEQTKAVLSRLGARTQILPPWFDVDRPDDLLRLKNCPNLEGAPTTKLLLSRLEEQGSLGDLV